MNIAPNESHPAFRRGVTDGLEQGVYDQSFHDRLRETDPSAAWHYKQGYDRGVARYCETLDNETT